MIKIIGKVIKGKNRGAALGYRTANIRLHRKIPQGIYISKTKLYKTIYPSVTFVGNATTFDESEVFVETHILSFSSDIYGEWISVELIKKIRDNHRFENVEALVKQIKNDILKTKEYFNV